MREGRYQRGITYFSTCLFIELRVPTQGPSKDLPGLYCFQSMLGASIMDTGEDVRDTQRHTVAQTYTHIHTHMYMYQLLDCIS